MQRAELYEHFWRVAIRRLAKPRAVCHVDLAKSSPVATSAAFALVSLILSFVPAAASAAHWWEQGQSRVIGLSTGFAGPDKFDPAELAARKAALGFNAERLTIMQRHGGIDDKGFFFVSTAAGQINEDYLRRYLVESKKHGVRVVIFFDVHYYNQAFADEHPFWMQRNENGSMPKVYDTGLSPCINSPYRDWVFQVLRDLAAYAIDGVFFDGPIFFPGSCYCEHCKRKWDQQHAGESMPSKKQRSGEAFQKLIDFQARSLADFLHDSNRTLKGINPELALYMNSGVRGANWATGRMNRILVQEQDLLASEGGFLGGDMTRLSLWKPGLNARLLETQAPNKPRQIYTAASHKPWTFSLLPAPELRLCFFDAIANGAACSFAFTPIDLNQPEADSVAPLNQYLAQNERYYLGTKSEARTALVWSDVTANFYTGAAAQMIDIDRVAARSEIGNLDGEFSGLADALVRSHTPFDVIDDVSLEREPLDRYQTLVLPNVACLSDTVAARLSEWVQRGGTLIATFETSLYDQVGRQRKNFALAQVFGADTAGRIVGPMLHDFMQPLGQTIPGSKAQSPKSLARELLEATVYHVAAEANTADVSIRFMKPLAGRYAGLPQPSEDPALLIQSFGKGRAIYFTGDLGNTIQTFHLAAHLDLLKPWLSSPITISNAPGSVEVVLRSQENGSRWLLHLVNATGEMTRPIQNIIPVHNIEITFPVNHPVHKVTAIRSGQSLPVTKDGQVQTITLPTLNEYELLVVE
jgi:Hypothetical glycosyl hydrolase 6/Beta-galactosidase trimerisation domain